MNIVAIVALLQLSLTATVSVSDNKFPETVLTVEPGDVVILPCYTRGDVTPPGTTWTKNGSFVGKTGSSATDTRVTVLPGGSLVISGTVVGDQGIYLCNSTLPDSSVYMARVLLQVTKGPNNISADILNASKLSNGTWTTSRGSRVYFHCVALSPSWQLSWTFSGAPSNNNTLTTTTSKPYLDYVINDIQPSDQGVYTCSATNTVSNLTVHKSNELLVYYISNTHPDCMWIPNPDLSFVQLNCSWSSVYPPPKLHWGEDADFQETDELSVRLNSSQVSDGQKVTCTAHHMLLEAGKEKSCSLILKVPYPTGKPLVTAVEATNVTLTCSEVEAIPLANITWRKGVKQTIITSGSKYVLSDEYPAYMLTIVNVSKDDQNCYFCRTENQLGVRELEVCLTVTTSSSAYAGVFIGVFIAALIVGSTFIIAKVLYSRRHQICLGGGLGDEDGGDVLSLVDSEDEQVFQDTVPHLPPIANGHHTTLVQIHRIPSCDHEEAEAAETNPQQPEETEQPEDLVIFSGVSNASVQEKT